MTQDTKLLSASVIGDGIVAFGGDMTAQEIEDTRNLYRVATLVANKMFDKEADSRGWCRQFSKVMGDLGWINQHFQYERSTDQSRSLTVDNVIADLMGTALTGVVTQLGLAQVATELAGKAIKLLPNDQAAYTLFKDNTVTKSGGRVSVSTFAKLDDHTVYMVTGTTELHSQNAPGEALIFNWDSAHYESYEGSMVMNIGVVEAGKNRDAISAKLDGVTQEKLVTYLDML